MSPTLCWGLVDLTLVSCRVSGETVVHATPHCTALDGAAVGREWGVRTSPTTPGRSVGPPPTSCVRSMGESGDSRGTQPTLTASWTWRILLGNPSVPCGRRFSSRGSPSDCFTPIHPMRPPPSPSPKPSGRSAVSRSLRWLPSGEGPVRRLLLPWVNDSLIERCCRRPLWRLSWVCFKPGVRDGFVGTRPALREPGDGLR